MLHSNFMLSRRSWAAALVVAPSLVSCVPAEDLSSYSRGSGGGSGGRGSGADGLQVSSNPLPEPDGGPSAEEEPASRDLDASAAGGQTADGSAPGTPEGADTGAGSDAGDPVQAPACDVSEVSGPNGNCYLAVATLVSWSDARASCQALGAGWDLASIRSAVETEFWAPRLAFEAWVGASDATTEGVWSWVSDGAQFWSGDGVTGAALNGAYTNWNTDEPNGADNSDCARLLPRTDALPDRNAPWADLECTQLLGALCEGPPGSG